MGYLQPIRLREQQHLQDEDQEYINSLDLSYSPVEMGEIPHFLGLSADGWSSYYVGATWLKEGCRPLVVLPKFDQIDFMRIFADAIKDNIAPEYFQESYTINFEAPLIEEASLNSVLTPLIIAHYLSVISQLVKHGLKHNYVQIEENLKGKVRGHVLPLRNLQNVLRGHSEMILCRYQEYSLNYPENRLLKRALLACESMLLSLGETNNKLLQLVRNALVPFCDVDADITPSAVKGIRKDKLHGEYPLAIQLAKMILRRTDFSISEKSESNRFVPQFAVDMSRLFEFHVLSLLRKKFPTEKIYFQKNAGIMGRCDYLIPCEHLIVDAKYKTDYPDKPSEVLRTDIREVSGYGRSESILQAINITDHSQPPCLIIYPNGIYENNSVLEDGPILSTATPFCKVENFYTLGVSLPLIN